LQWANFSDTGGIGRTPHQFDDAMTFLETDARMFSPYMISMEGFNPPGTGDLTLYGSKSGGSLSEVLHQGSGSATTESSIAPTSGHDSEQHFYQSQSNNNNNSNNSNGSSSSININNRRHHSHGRSRRSHSRRASPKHGRGYPSTPGTGTSADDSSAGSPGDSDHGGAHSLIIDDWESKPWRYDPVEAGSLRLAGFPDDGKRCQGNYFTSPFWLWSSGQVSDGS
jgi:hypothetical protein